MNPGGCTQQNGSCSAIYLSSRNTFKADKRDMLGTADKVRVTSLTSFFYGLQHMDILVLTNQQKLTFIPSVKARDVIEFNDWQGRMVKESQRKPCNQRFLIDWLIDVINLLNLKMEIDNDLRNYCAFFFMKFLRLQIL